MALTFYLVASAILLFIGSSIWSGKGWHNIGIKATLAIVGAIGVGLAIVRLGWLS